MSTETSLSLRTSEATTVGWRGLEGHQPLRAIAFGRPIEGGLYLLACSDRDAALVRQDEGRNGVAAGDGLQVPRGQSLPVADEEAL
jgi:hypothetical protein